NVYDFFMLTTGAATLYVYLTIAYSQLRIRKKLEAEGVKIDFKMWMFPYLTYVVIFAIIGAILTMLIEGTYFKEVIYTTALFGIIVFFGLLSEKLGWGKERRATHLTPSHEEKLV
ncbi:GABA permease, partial [Pseudomonas aeruginosa]